MKNKITTYLQLHLLEFKYNLILFLFLFLFSFLTCYYFADQLIYLFVKILIRSNLLKYFIFTNVTEMFITNVFISFCTSLFFSIQFLFLQIWFFVSKGLFKHENLKLTKLFFVFLIWNISIIFIILIKLIPNLWLFFVQITFSNEYLLDIHFEPKIDHYFFFLFNSFLYIYLFFIYFFLLFYLVTCKFFKKKNIIYLRKFFYIKFIVMGGIITPPDIFNQILFLFFFILFFEIFLFMYFYLHKYSKDS